MTYPDGEVVEYAYGSAGGIDDVLGRVYRITSDDTTPLVYAEYSYLGDGTIVATAHPEVDGGLTLSYGSAGDAGGGFAGLDRFGRVVDQKWTVDGDAVDEFRYGYDRGGNRTFRENKVARDASLGLDEWYVYDGLDRLIASTRGSLGGGTFPNYTGILGTPSNQQGWALDQLG
ncbi:MAG: hypothetical protein PHU85_15840, partial [Phycisphaerae bacterium]|nr:hypothetical protein [Phycisphaerae bacterium]